ncbi:MAG: hypothetical protein A2445_00410 [Candidatus Jacksonbacteria bacterium RIFOXYC2_FULL_44_29]|nr:MAG: hypothetical protein UW45_C0017G0016 [Parcubacteria group bacterium GW2011_GWC2_44_22]OGY74814.1 MAG: hypothetical protein A2240_02345 [Candidatus Jacksonbacteria bacterium RIFOXYA2_FULL_43_12]OGY77749.1 MAG: hypothetical protein A2295_03035 [Candidatus Jacksonbacteria bacterium RIFOXYB2_FULL_44_15]OGY78885.1 MAG: hypothetical protein A2550_05095 [Candidatus Jacksonbacteria bacterium RIFOXYD2_FULL_43_21]OGY79136.1 MAG: hypothetical protein A2445_00410 [Candidatus Jacksonbacteria bacteri
MKRIVIVLLILFLFLVNINPPVPNWHYNDFDDCLEYNPKDHKFHFIVDPRMQRENWWITQTPDIVKQMATENKPISAKGSVNFQAIGHESWTMCAIIRLDNKKLRIALVVQPCPVLLNGNVPFNPVRTNTWPQSQVALASCLQEDFKVKLLDLRSLDDSTKWRDQIGDEYLPPIKYGEMMLTRHLVGDYSTRIMNTDANVFVLTANFTAEANSIATVMRIIKKSHPTALILVGGRDAGTPERHKFYFKAGADYIGIGDGDVALSNFFSALSRGIQPNDRKILGGINRTFRPQLFDFKLIGFDQTRYTESGGGPIVSGIISKNGFAAYFETSRGCSGVCEYCTEANTQLWRLPVSEVIRHFDHYIQAGCQLFMISDDNLLLRRPSELIAIFNYMRDQNVAWEFPVGLETQRLTDRNGKVKKELFEALFWNSHDEICFSGAHRLLLPLEDSLLRESRLTKLDRLHTPEASNIIKHLLETEIPFLNLAVMIGAPEESAVNRARLEQNLEVLYKITRGSKTRVNFSLFCTSPLPGTPFGRRMASRLSHKIEAAPELWTVFSSVINGDAFTAEETTQYRRALLERYNMSQRDGKVSPT